MRIHVTWIGPAGDTGQRVETRGEIDAANQDEAYVKGREFAALAGALQRGMLDADPESFVPGEPDG